MNTDETNTGSRAFKDIVEGNTDRDYPVAPPVLSVSQLVEGVDSDTNELLVNEKIVAQNIVNQQAGLPPISNDLVHPAHVDEDELSPIYPKMSQLVEAAEYGEPISVNENAVKAVENEVHSLEKDNRNGYATNLVAMRQLIDAIEAANNNTEEYTGTVRSDNLTADAAFMRDIIEAMNKANSEPTGNISTDGIIELTNNANVSAVNSATSAALAASTSAAFATSNATILTAHVDCVERKLDVIRYILIGNTIAAVFLLLNYFFQ